MKVVLASSNRGKLRELNELLAEIHIEAVSQSEFGVSDAEETGLTFVENAIIKARHAATVTGLPAIADDSGLEVDALNGDPGVFSARYSGVGATDRRNLEKLLAELQGVDGDRRSARFHCILVYMRHQRDPTPIICHGIWEGSIAGAPSGDNGFGYDPVFIVPGRGCTAAELPAGEKNRLSHRGQALRQLLDRLASDAKRHGSLLRKPHNLAVIEPPGT
jgi:XTP/dITP diphosphohydrolase